jgi:hypothetical protein
MVIPHTKNEGGSFRETKKKIKKYPHILSSYSHNTKILDPYIHKLLTKAKKNHLSYLIKKREEKN